MIHMSDYKYNIVQLSTGHYVVKRTTPITGNVVYMSLMVVGNYYEADEAGVWSYCISKDLETVERLYMKLTATEAKVIK